MKRLMLVAAVTAVCAVFAQGKGPHPGPGGERRMGPPLRDGMMMDPIVRMVSNPRAAETLGLSDEQQAKLKEINKPSSAGRENAKKMREAVQRQIELMKAEKIDEAAVMAAIDQVFDLRKAQAKEQAKRVIAVKSVLTPEQIRKAHDEMVKMRPPRGERGMRGPRGEGRGPRAAKPEAKPETKPEAQHAQE